MKLVILWWRKNWGEGAARDGELDSAALGIQGLEQSGRIFISNTDIKDPWSIQFGFGRGLRRNMRSPTLGSTMPMVFHLSLPTPANTVGPSLAVYRGLGPQGSLGLWLKSRDGEKGGRRLGEKEEEKKAGARSKKAEG